MNKIRKFGRLIASIPAKWLAIGVICTVIVIAGLIYNAI